MKEFDVDKGSPKALALKSMIESGIINIYEEDKFDYWWYLYMEYMIKNGLIK